MERRVYTETCRRCEKEFQTDSIHAEVICNDCEWLDWYEEPEAVPAIPTDDQGEASPAEESN